MNSRKMILAALPLAMIGCASQDDSLQGKLDEKKAQWEVQASDETEQTYDDGIQAVREAGVLESMKQVGDTAPDFTLPDAKGNQVNLNDLLADGPVIVVFYRGAWCPYCNLTLAAWQQKLDEIHALGGELVAISPQMPDYSLTSQEKNGLQFHVLSDVGHGVSDRFGTTMQVTPEVLKLWEGRIDLEAHNGEDSGKLPLAATFLIDTDGTIKFAHAHPDYRVRAEPGEVVAALRKLHAERDDSASPEADQRRHRRMY